MMVIKERKRKEEEGGKKTRKAVSANRYARGCGRRSLRTHHSSIRPNSTAKVNGKIRMRGPHVKGKGERSREERGSDNMVRTLALTSRSSSTCRDTENPEEKRETAKGGNGHQWKEKEKRVKRRNEERKSWEKRKGKRGKK